MGLYVDVLLTFFRACMQVQDIFVPPLIISRRTLPLSLFIYLSGCISHCPPPPFQQSGLVQICNYEISFYYSSRQISSGNRIFFISNKLRGNFQYTKQCTCLQFSLDRSRIHEHTVSLRFLGIILRVLRLEVSVFNV